MLFAFQTSFLLSVFCSVAVFQSVVAEFTNNSHTVISNSVAAAWFAGWHENQFPPEKVPWNKYTHAIYSFAVTTPEPTRLDESGLAGLSHFVEIAHKHGVKPLVSIGGWTGSRWFSTAVRTSLARKAFVTTVTDLAVKYKVDGLDFDWEFPNGLGVGCNSINASDTSNFLSFLQELRSHPVGRELILTAAVGLTPWLDADGRPITDVSGFAEVLDYIAIMNYDVWGPWSSTVGPNAPLDDICAPKEARIGSARSGVQSWKKGGMPARKVVLGIPSYGHSFRVRRRDAFVKGSTTRLALYPVFEARNQPAGDEWDDQPGIDVCGVNSTVPGGIIQYWGMIKFGYLDAKGNPRTGRPYRFDTCSKTAFIYDPEKEIMVSYDNPDSMGAKERFIKEHSLGGFSMWEAGGDYNAQLLGAFRERRRQKSQGIIRL